MLIVIAVVVTVVAILLLFFRHSFLDLERGNGSSIEFSLEGIKVKPPPDHYSENGLDNIGRYISRLVSSPSRKKSLNIFTPDKKRACGIFAKDSQVEVSLIVMPYEGETREANIRSFFVSRGIPPSSDYLAQSGTVRILTYPLHGTEQELTVFTKMILQQLCGISHEEALNVRYSEQ